MAQSPQLSGLLRRAVLWLAIALAAGLIARQLRGPESRAPAASGESASAATDEVLADLVPDLVAALGRRDTRFVMDHVATGFKEERGLDYYDVRALVETAVLSEPPLGVRLDKLELTPLGDGSRQIATGSLAFARGQRLLRGAPLPEGAVSYAVEVVFAKQGPRWLALTGTYRREPAPGSEPAATAPATPPTDTR